MPAAPTCLLLASASLGGPARGALVCAMVAAVLLLFFGARLLRPAVVLALMLAGFVFAVVLARTMLPTLPLWIAAAAGAVVGLIAGALLYRPAVGLVAAWVGAMIGALVAWAIIAGGALDTAPRDLGHALIASPREAAIPGDGERTGLAILQMLSGPTEAGAGATGTDATGAVTSHTSEAASAEAGTPPASHAHLATAANEAAARTADAALPIGERLLRDAADTAARIGGRLSDAIGGIAPAYRTLMLASIAAGGLIGFLAGLLATTTVARILTSFAGAWLLLVSTLPLLALHGYEPLPPDTRVWLLTLAVLAIGGVVAQSTSGSAPKRAAPAKAIKPAPTRAPNADAG